MTTTLIAALGIEGVRCSLVTDGAVNSDIFESFVRHVLLSELKPGDVVVMDNLSSHKGAAIRRLIEDAGAELEYLPPYSPDLNPIELVFSKLKRLLRRAGERTVDGLWGLLGRVHEKFPTDECRRYIAHCGYRANPRNDATPDRE